MFTSHKSRSSDEGNNYGKEGKMVYIVSIDYNKFEFMNGNTAINFAELALGSAVGDVRVEITLKPVPAPEITEEGDDF